MNAIPLHSPFLNEGLMTYVETKNNTDYVLSRIFNFMRVSIFECQCLPRSLRFIMYIFIYLGSSAKLHQRPHRRPVQSASISGAAEETPQTREARREVRFPLSDLIHESNQIKTSHNQPIHGKHYLTICNIASDWDPSCWSAIAITCERTDTRIY